MLLYINGDSHSAGAEAYSYHAFANDDNKYWGTPHRHGHANNLKVCFGTQVADAVGASWINHSESGSSNQRIIRSTEVFLETSDIKDLVILIGWSTWEREEWLHNGIYYQVTASGTDTVPTELQDKYKQWVIDTTTKTAENELHWHDAIYNFHLRLKKQGIRHLFFNTYRYFAHIKQNNIARYNWGNNYINPYDEKSTYYYWLQEQGFKTVNKNSYHYGADAHKKWANFLVPYLTDIS